jgi:hypothetical protein
MIRLFTVPTGVRTQINNEPVMLLMGIIDQPFTPRHVLWHFIHSLAMALDGLMGIASFGFRFPGFTAYIEEGGLNWLYHHAKADHARRAAAVRYMAMKHLGMSAEQAEAESLETLGEMVTKKLQNEAVKLVQEVLDTIKETNEDVN